jgi:hypothetical protein
VSDVALVDEPTVEEEERKTSYLGCSSASSSCSRSARTAPILEDTSPQGFARAALVLAMVW